MADHPLRPATDRSLGGPLPRQPANRTQAPQEAAFAFGTRSHPGASCGLSRSFPRLSPTPRQVPTRSSPVRHCGAETPPSDLHVLGMPPAFALSQDQTLRFIQHTPTPRTRTDHTARATHAAHGAPNEQPTARTLSQTAAPRTAHTPRTQRRARSRTRGRRRHIPSKNNR